MTEVLAPCGGKDSFFVVINNGADAVYLGLDNFSARKNADNFSIENIAYFVNYAHLFGVKVYVCINTLIKDSEIDELIEVTKQAYLQGVDAFIVQDIFLGKMLKGLFPNICLHLSTQAGVSNIYGAKQAKEFGFCRVVLARETEINEIKEISKIIETEVFVHGALCSSYSGHCYFSSVVGGNSGNRGLCRQPCRQKYTYSFNNKECYALSLSDLCLVDRIKELVNAGVTSFKIEGRMRSPEYVGSTVQLYKKALNGENYQKEYALSKRSYNRGNFTIGYVFGEDKNLLSTKVQGHLGEEIGEVEIFKDGKILLKNNYLADCGFKILRNGVEVGSGKMLTNGNLMNFNGDVKKGDRIFITKDSSISESLLGKRVKNLVIDAKFLSGQKAQLSCEGIVVYSSENLVLAKNQPIDKQSLLNNLQKTDIYPFKIESLNFETDGCFLPKSELNKLRKSLYEQIFYKNKEKRTVSDSLNYKFDKISTDEKKELAIISSHIIEDKNNIITHYIYAPTEYTEKNIREFYQKSQNLKSEKYLYIPCYLTQSEIENIKNFAKYFSGFYVEGAFGINLCKELNIKCFGGVELNIFNTLDENEISKKCENYCHSKEITYKNVGNGFVLALGSIKTMSLIYCPNGRNCHNCNVKDLEILQDYANRQFPIRRYKTSKCRFEVYNDCIICAKKPLNKMLFDFSGMSKAISQDIFDIYCEQGLYGVSLKYKHTQYSLNNGIK